MHTNNYYFSSLPSCQINNGRKYRTILEDAYVQEKQIMQAEQQKKKGAQLQEEEEDEDEELDSSSTRKSVRFLKSFVDKMKQHNSTVESCPAMMILLFILFCGQSKKISLNKIDSIIIFDLLYMRKY